MEAFWVNQIFDKYKNSVRKCNVESLMMQMIALEIIVIIWKQNKLFYTINRVRYTINKYKEIPKYNDQDVWKGIKTHDEQRQCKFKQQKLVIIFKKFDHYNMITLYICSC